MGHCGYVWDISIQSEWKTQKCNKLTLHVSQIVAIICQNISDHSNPNQQKVGLSFSAIVQITSFELRDSNF